MTITEKLLNQLNESKNLSIGQVGYSYFADIGHGVKSIWTVTNKFGGVRYSNLNATSSRKRCQRIRTEISKVELSVR